MTEQTKTKNAGRPSGTGSRILAVAELALLIGDKDIGVPVPYRWLVNLGAEPNDYPLWDRKTVKQKEEKVVNTPLKEEESLEENTEIEYTLVE